MADTLRITCYVDPGHSWYAVRRELVERMGIAREISSCSYADDTMVYAEEDCDAPVVLTALDDSGVAYVVLESRTDGDSWVRGLSHYNAAEYTPRGVAPMVARA